MSYLSVVSRTLKGLLTLIDSDSHPNLASQLSTEKQAEKPLTASNNFETIVWAITQKKPVTLIHGRAGTGKTTLIRKLLRETKLNHVVVAPTGVAALNAGGQTIHSFFGIRPRMINLDEITPRNRLKTILRRLDFIVIDEISMVRADLLDVVDRTLRVNRGCDEPFGGVPMLLVGDFLQLPPIVEKADSEILRNFGYQSHFAFGAKCMQTLKPTIIELTTVYRQKEVEFIELLGQLRVGEKVHEVVEALNHSCHKPHRKSATPVTLTAKTASAEQHNLSGLAALPGKTTTYTGTVVGDFALKNKRLPAPEFLDLKIGARVMLVKNDPNKRWVNGSLGTITRLAADSVFVCLDENSTEYQVTTETWESIKYEWDYSRQRIEATVIGSYSQVPVIPAWAITIHKAQGLTLSDVRVDLGDGAFSEGQTYVALSRAKSINGLSFAKPLSIGDVKVNPDLVEGVKFLASRSLRSGVPGIDPCTDV